MNNSVLKNAKTVSRKKSSSDFLVRFRKIEKLEFINLNPQTCKNRSQNRIYKCNGTS